MTQIVRDYPLIDSQKRYTAAFSTYLEAEFVAATISHCARIRCDSFKTELQKMLFRLGESAIHLVKPLTIKDFETQVLRQPLDERSRNLVDFMACSTAAKRALLLQQYLVQFQHVQDFVNSALDKVLEGAAGERRRVTALAGELVDGEERSRYFTIRGNRLGDATYHELTTLRCYQEEAFKWEERRAILDEQIHEANLLYQHEVKHAATVQTEELAWRVQNTQRLDKLGKKCQNAYSELLMGQSSQYDNDENLQELLTICCCITSQKYCRLVHDLSKSQLPCHTYWLEIRDFHHEDDELSD